MRRRRFIAGLGAGAATLAGACEYWPEDGLENPCLAAELPAALADGELVRGAWDGLDPDAVWDAHAHLLGLGDSGSGAWVNPDMRSWWRPGQRLRFEFFMNAACVDDAEHVDETYLARLLACANAFPAGSRLVLLAFDYAHDEGGSRLPDLSNMHVPNRYVREVAARHPGRLEWAASIHPYREDCVAALEQAARDGARAVKWLPPAMGMDPASPRCDPFYAALVRLDLPLISHGGRELAVHGAARQDLGNPLRLRRALDHGVRVIVAHCASMGDDVDLDVGPEGPRVSSFDLFARLMDEPRYESLLFGDISAMPQLNRIGPALDTVLERDDWHPRLLNGSDYPLPAVVPLFSVTALVERGYLGDSEAQVVRAIRPHNPLLFDFVLKRNLARGGKRFSNAVFETRRILERRAT